MANKKRRTKPKPLTRWQRFWRWLTERLNYASGGGVGAGNGGGGGNGGG